MTVVSRAEQASNFRTTQILTAVFSVIFFFVIAYGYFNLFIRSGVAFALVGAIIMPVFAWYLARVTGQSPGGIRKNWIFLVPLFIVSAAGVYNSFMVYLEGSQIMADTAVDAEVRFGELQRAGEAALAQAGVTAHLNRVQSSSEALFNEIRNPQACGQGPEASRRIAELQRELPGFVPLSHSGGCAHNDEVVGSYKDTIANLSARAPWNNADLQLVVSGAIAARSNLETLRSQFTSNSPLILHRALETFQDLDTRYRDLRFRLSKFADVRDLRASLDTIAVESLGNVFKLPSLIFSRLDRGPTYFYLFVAVCSDIFMVFLFKRVAAVRPPRRIDTGGIGRAF